MTAFEIQTREMHTPLPYRRLPLCEILCKGLTGSLKRQGRLWLHNPPPWIVCIPSGRGMWILLDLVNLIKDIIPATRMYEPCSPCSTGVRHPLGMVPCAEASYPVGYLVGGFYLTLAGFRCPISPTQALNVVLFLCRRAITLINWSKVEVGCKGLQECG